MASEIGEPLRKLVADRAGRACEYCRIHEEDSGYGHQVDHIISRKHNGRSIEHNLAYACIVCNRNKGSDIASVHPESDKIIRLFNPRRDRWSEHFQLDGALIRPISGIGVATVRLLKMNMPERIEERRALQLTGRYPVSSWPE